MSVPKITGPARPLADLASLGGLTARVEALPVEASASACGTRQKPEHAPASSVLNPKIGQGLSLISLFLFWLTPKRGDLALYTITVPRQDLSGGLLRLQALEGHVGQMALQGQVKGRDLKLVSAQAAKLTSEGQSSLRAP